MLDTKGLRESQNSACPQSCPNCCQAEATQDNSGHDGDDDNGERRNPAKATGKSLLEVVRLLAEMAPDERATLVELLKALG